MRFSGYAVLVALVILIQGCDSQPDMLTNSEQESIKKLRSGDYTLVKNDDLAALKRDAETGKSVGRYQIHNEGFRAWRMDTATGHVCLLLAPKAAWKDLSTSLQACDSE